MEPEAKTAIISVTVSLIVGVALGLLLAKTGRCKDE
jgi:uncharacterized protein YneF (UPF0154 family)